MIDKGYLQMFNEKSDIQSGLAWNAVIDYDVFLLSHIFIPKNYVSFSTISFKNYLCVTSASADLDVSLITQWCKLHLNGSAVMSKCVSFKRLRDLRNELIIMWLKLPVEFLLTAQTIIEIFKIYTLLSLYNLDSFHRRYYR